VFKKSRIVISDLKFLENSNSNNKKLVTRIESFPDDSEGSKSQMYRGLEESSSGMFGD